MIAFSTSVHLGVIFLGSTMGMAGLVLFHIITHGFVKASAFVSSGVVIGARGDQDLRNWGISMEMMIMNLSFLLLCGIGRGIIFSSKEFIMLEFVRVLVIVVRWNYSKVFFSNVSSYNTTMTLIRCSSLLLLLVGRSRFSGLDLVSIFSSIILFIMVFNSMAGYVVNK
jgi:NADH:ubiquinone oxidoreductase subunit 5 (subunit L)/multisubunit Na+/H+ antiporter MnhA subunit